jgi:hypothetical protein
MESLRPKEGEEEMRHDFRLRGAAATVVVMSICGLAAISGIDIVAAGWIREGRVLPYRIVFGLLLWVAAFVVAVLPSTGSVLLRVFLGGASGYVAAFFAILIGPVFEGRNVVKMVVSSVRAGGLVAVLAVLAAPLVTLGWALGVLTFLGAYLAEEAAERIWGHQTVSR